LQDLGGAGRPLVDARQIIAFANVSQDEIILYSSAPPELNAADPGGFSQTHENTIIICYYIVFCDFWPEGCLAEIQLILFPLHSRNTALPVCAGHHA
jgi:hypothetical protein